MNELLGVALELARGAGKILRRAYLGPASVIREKSTAIDLVTETDRESEDFLIGEITKRFPDHAVLAEESGVSGFDGPYRWVIDPLDGTVNFAHRVPTFCVLIAVQERLASGEFRTAAGITYDPLRDEMFTAARGGGAFLNGERIHVSATSRLIDAMLTTGFMYDRLFRDDNNHREFCRLNLLTQGVRRIGSAGLDLAYVACGRFDASWEYCLKLWDLAAGALLVEEAGGRVTDIEGGAEWPGGNAVASNGVIHSAVLKSLAVAKTLPLGSRAGLGDELPEDLAARLSDLGG
ncbi:MAG: hypothetical protein A2289_10815 [Deltaproteobacteria bacterium RIFOXYA12_FULL_58_15]|nr:MAG: hypothetical protein A2289_10815 [Deltaproteobacteria bacterium RIFOXYA12_FULL_58_15]